MAVPSAASVAYFLAFVALGGKNHALQCQPFDDREIKALKLWPGPG